MLFFLMVLAGVVCCASANTIDEDNEQGRIVGGRTARDGEFPYQVSLRSSSTGSHFCGGSVIGDNWILTAAHCVHNTSASSIVAVVATNYLNSSGVSYTIAEVVAHSDYNPKNISNDIALLKLHDTVATSSKVKSISLATSPPPPGSTLVLSGWGLTRYPSNKLPNELQTINLRSISVSLCKALLPGLPVHDANVCTHSNRGQGACKGDSGGPLVWNGEQVGIVSWGIPCAKGNPDVFTSVAAYRSWIKSSSSL